MPRLRSDPGTHSGRVEKPPLVHPLWCRETAAPATCPSMCGLPRFDVWCVCVCGAMRSRLPCPAR
eukprot:824585-Pyramimonas_sp.AAC.1